MTLEQLAMLAERRRRVLADGERLGADVDAGVRALYGTVPVPSIASAIGVSRRRIYQILKEEER